MKSDGDWCLSGSYFETCNCLSACPCVWKNPPSEGDCKLLVSWHIEHGHFDDVSLNDLNVALACYAPGNMKNGGWQAALYLDARGDADQQGALRRIFSGEAGGHLAVLMGLVGDVMGIKATKIEYRESGNERRLVIPGVARAEIEAVHGINGGVPTIQNPLLCVVPSHVSIVAKSSEFTYHDYDKDWTFSNRNGFYSDFDYRP